MVIIQRFINAEYGKAAEFLRGKTLRYQLDQGGALGVSFHLANQRQKMAAGFYRQRLIAPLVNVPKPNGPRFRVRTLRVRQGDPLRDPTCVRLDLAAHWRLQ